MMRTTLNLPEDVYRVARSLAGARGISLGDAVAELVRQGFKRPAGVDMTKSFPCFVIPVDSPPITLEHTLAAEDEL